MQENGDNEGIRAKVKVKVRELSITLFISVFSYFVVLWLKLYVWIHNLI